MYKYIANDELILVLMHQKKKAGQKKNIKIDKMMSISASVLKLIRHGIQISFYPVTKVLNFFLFPLKNSLPQFSKFFSPGFHLFFFSSPRSQSHCQLSIMPNRKANTNFRSSSIHFSFL